MKELFPREYCDTATEIIRRTQHDADLMLDMLGLTEQTGHATTRDNGHKGYKGTSVTRRPLWEEPVIGDLRPVGGKSVTTKLGAGWLQ